MASNGGPRIFVDGDACPVKEEVYRVAERYGLHVYVVANAALRVPRTPAVELIVVEAGADAADDWIAERAQAHDIVVTSDIPLADRSIKAGATAIGSNGRPFTSDSIGMALAQRGIMEHLRSTGETTGGPKPFSKEQRSRFLSALDEAVNRARRAPG